MNVKGKQIVMTCIKVHEQYVGREQNTSPDFYKQSTSTECCNKYKKLKWEVTVGSK